MNDTRTNQFWFMVPNPGANPLPASTTITLSGTITTPSGGSANGFNAEGSAYRPFDHKLYTFQCDSDNTGPCDLYQVDTSTGVATKIKDDIIEAGNRAVEGAIFQTHYATSTEALYVTVGEGTSGSNSNQIRAFDPDGPDDDPATTADNWSPIGSPIAVSGVAITGLAYDPRANNGAGQFYGSDDRYAPAGNNSNVDIYSIDMVTGATTFVAEAQLAVDGEGLTFAADGLLYLEEDQGASGEGRSIFTIDPANGNMMKAATFGGTADAESLSCNAGARSDYGDAPASYGYAAHSLPVFANTDNLAFLGTNVDDDDNIVAQAAVGNALGDDNDTDNDPGNDDDGVTVGGTGLQGHIFAIGDTVTIDIMPGSDVAGSTGFLNAWIDFNGDGDFNDAGEQIAADVVGTAGTAISLNVTVPSTGYSGNTYARFRYSVNGGDGPSNDVFNENSVRNDEEAFTGEVEDYQIQLLGTISGQVRLDVDQDGDLNDADGGIAGVTVELRDSSNNVVGTTTTAADGSYSFTGLSVGDYTVIETDPANHVSTQDSDGGNDNRIAVTLGSSGVASGNDFLDTNRGNIYGHLFIDTNGNGTQDAGEPNLPNVDVDITDSQGIHHIVTSDADGDWVAVDIVGGTATVDVDETDADFPANHNTTATASSDPSTVTVVVNTATDAGNDGYQPNPGTVSGHLFIDTNGNGTQDAGEPDLPNVDVVITDSTGATQTVSTDASGNYSANVPAGSTTTNVDETDPDFPANHTQTAGMDPTTVTVPAGGNGDAGVDGYQPNPGTVTGHLFIDTNGNGTQDAGEPNLPNVDVVITDALGNVQTVSSDANGNYTATGVAPGTATVNVDETDTHFPANHTQTAGTDPSNVSVPTGGTVDAGNDGYRPNPGTVSGHLFIDTNGNGTQDAGEPDLPNVDVVITDSTGATQTVSTDASGNYSANVPAGSTTTNVDETDPDFPANHTQTAGADPTTVTVPAGGNGDAGVDGYQPNQGSISGQVRLDTDADGDPADPDSGIGGVTVVLRDSNGAIVATTTTAADGTYSFGNVAPGDYTIEETDPMNHTSTADVDGANDNRIAVSLTAGADSTGNDFLDTALGSIGNYVWHDDDMDGIQDAEESGIAGVTVQLLDGNGAVIDTTTTDGNGFYGFDGLAAGNYEVRFVAPAGYSFTAQNQGSGSLRDSFDSDADAATGRTGVFSLAAGENNETTDAGLSLASNSQPASLGDRVWYDTNGNGLQDAGEPGLSSVTVNLYDAAGTTLLASTVTDGSGNYAFTGLAPGSYSLEFVAPAGHVISPEAQGGNTAIDSDANPTTGFTAVVALQAGDAVTGIDAGMSVPQVQPASLSDRVWYDTDGDGIQDAGEPGLGGVTVTLYAAANPGTVLATTVTDANGNYSFQGLPADDYVVHFAAPANHVISPAGQAPGNADSDPDPATGLTAIITLVAGENNSDIDAGMYVPNATLVSIGDVVWNDLNGDGNQDAGEAGLSGVDIVLYDASGNELLRVTTSSDGSYLFDNLVPGDYRVEVDTTTLPLGMIQTGDPDATFDSAHDLIGLNADISTVDFGYQAQSAALSLEKFTNGSDADNAPGMTLPVGAAITWSYRVENIGNVSLTAIAVTDDQLPDADIRCPVDDNDNVIDDLAVGGVVTCVATGIATAGQYTNVGAVSGTPPSGPPVTDTDPSNYFGEQIDLELTKTVSGGPHNVGDTVTFTVQVLNNGPSNATGVAVQDVVPNGYANISNISNGGSASGGTITWSGLSIANGATASLTYQAVIQSSGNYTNVAQVTAADQPDVDSTPGNDVPGEDDQDTAVVTPGAVIDLELTKTVSSGPYNVGDTVTFTVQVLNNGPSNATGVAVQDVVPNGYANISNISNGGSASGSTITWSGLSIANGVTVSLTYQAVIQASGSYTNVAQVTAADQPDVDSTPGNDVPGEDDQDTAVVTPGAVIDLSLVKTVSGGPVYHVGDVVTFTLTVANDGPSDATGVEVTDPVPDGYEAIANISNGGSLSGNTVVWSGLSIAAGTSQSLSFDATLRDGGDYLNIAEVTDSNEVDTDSIPNNQDPNEDDIGDALVVVNPALPPPPAHPIPTLSGWLLMLLSTMLSGIAVGNTRRKRQ
ncbi:SdrD B-like domain-containing protein [Thiolapillus sp.]